MALDILMQDTNPLKPPNNLGGTRDHRWERGGFVWGRIKGASTTTYISTKTT